MLFKLSIRNIRRSVKDYAIYFFTLVLAVAIFYIFNAIESQTAMLKVSETTHQLLDLMSTFMFALSILIAVVLGFLIIYASQFLMKRRKREFGIYMTLGMSKGKISKILLVETLIIGIFSLAIGLLLGVTLSQLLSVFVVNIFEADMSDFQFVFSESAFLGTIGSFGIIYLVVVLLNTFFVGKQKLIKLIHSDKMNERVKIRNLTINIIMMTIAVGLLIYCYSSITANISDLDEGKLGLIILFGCLATLMFFWSLSGLAMRIIPKFRRLYYKNLNTFIFREVNSKINTTVFSMTIISLLLFLVIVIFSSAMSINNTFSVDLKGLVPADFQATKFMSSDDEAGNNNLSVAEVLSKNGINTQETFIESVEIPIYKVDSVTYRETIGEKSLSGQGSISAERLEYMLDSQESIIKIDDYNKVARLYSHPEFSLDKDEYIVLANYESAMKARNQTLRDESPSLTIDDRILTPKYSETKDGFIEMSSNQINEGLILVPSDLDLSGDEGYKFFVGNYNADNDADRKIIEEEIQNKAVNNEALIINYATTASTKTQFYDQSVGISAVVTFIGLYLGSIFLITCAALLSLKELSESSDNQEKYLLLKKIGVDQGTMNRALFAQIAIFFGLPLAVAIVHSVFGILFVDKIMLTFMHSSLLKSIIMTAIFVVTIYGGYLLITYFMSKRIVSSKN